MAKTHSSVLLQPVQLGKALGGVLWYAIVVPLLFFVLTMLGAPIEMVDPVPKIGFSNGGWAYVAQTQQALLQTTVALPEELTRFVFYSNPRVYWNPNPNEWQWYALWIQGMLMVIGVIWIARQLRRLFKNIRARDPFHSSSVRGLRRVGFTLTGFAVAHWALSLWMIYNVGTGTKQQILFLQPIYEDRIEFVLLGLFVLAFAKVLEYGATLKREQELTV